MNEDCWRFHSNGLAFHNAIFTHLLTHHSCIGSF